MPSRARANRSPDRRLGRPAHGEPVGPRPRPDRPEVRHRTGPATRASTPVGKCRRSRSPPRARSCGGPARWSVGVDRGSACAAIGACDRSRRCRRRASRWRPTAKSGHGRGDQPGGRVDVPPPGPRRSTRGPTSVSTPGGWRRRGRRCVARRLARRSVGRRDPGGRAARCTGVCGGATTDGGVRGTSCRSTAPSRQHLTPASSGLRPRDRAPVEQGPPSSGQTVRVARRLDQRVSGATEGWSRRRSQAAPPLRSGRPRRAARRVGAGVRRPPPAAGRSAPALVRRPTVAPSDQPAVRQGASSREASPSTTRSTRRRTGPGVGQVGGGQPGSGPKRTSRSGPPRASATRTVTGRGGGSDRGSCPQEGGGAGSGQDPGLDQIRPPCR